MARLLRVALLGIVLFVSGCVMSLRPFYHAQDIVFDSALLGTWVKNDERWEFSRWDDQSYRLAHTDPQEHRGDFRVRMFRLGELLFLDLLPDYEELVKNELQAMHIAPAHFVLRVEILGPSLRIAGLDFNKFNDVKRIPPDTPAHLRIREQGEDRRVVFTASTEELQAFLVKYAKAEDASIFDEAVELERKESGI